jgi:hypothetical protein
MRSSNRLYTLLQVLPTADPAVIEGAYKALMKKYHPDLHGGTDAERRAAEISHAFNVLRDPDRRAEYDAGEKARHERYKVELSRAFPETHLGPADGAGRAPAPPPRFEREPRAGQRVAAWVGVAGAMVLTGTAILFARGVGDGSRAAVATSDGVAASAVAAEEAAADASPAAQPVPFRDQPVSGAQVTRAVADYRRIAATQGIQGAAAFSQRCFETQSRTLSVGDFDHCVAFDHIAGRADFQPSSPAQSLAARRFQPQNQVARHVRAADPLADTFASIEIRLYEIRRMVDAISLQPAEPQRLGVTSKPAVIRVPGPGRYTAQAPSKVKGAVTSRREPAVQEQDFLEREGGIY